MRHIENLAMIGRGSMFGAILLAIAGMFAAGTVTSTAAQADDQNALPIKARNIDVSRAGSNKRPRSVEDQAIVDGWPLYRTDRGQEAFNHAMATLQATSGPAPSAAVFKNCASLKCHITLPLIDKKGWIPAGRVWISPREYVLIVHSPRRRRGKSYRRNSTKRMKYFIYHEFQNSTHNTDPYDTISAHKFSVYVPFYMGKQKKDAQGNRFVVVVQVAPYDVRSIHASNMGSRGPGIEVAKNTAGKLQSLQGQAGILLAAYVKKAAPHLRVVNHRGSEGRPMLRAYKARLKYLRAHPRAPRIALPFVPAKEIRMEIVSASLGDLVRRPGLTPGGSARIQVAKRDAMGTIPRTNPRTNPLAGTWADPGTSSGTSSRTNTRTSPRPAARVATKVTPPIQARRPTQKARYAPEARPTPKARPTPVLAAQPVLTMSSLATYLKTNLLTMKQVPHFANFIPKDVAAVLEDGHEPGVVYLLDGRHNVLGKIHAREQYGVAVRDTFVYVPFGQDGKAKTNDKALFKLELDKPVFGRMAALDRAPPAFTSSANERPQLVAPPVLATRPISPPEPTLISPPRRVSQ